MTGNNAYFRYGDFYALTFAGQSIHPDWWSRAYEYPWALQFAKPEHVCADMGCGWMQRPFKDALATLCKRVYAVDADERLFDLPRRENLNYICADFTRETSIEAKTLDRVYCISVLEDLGDSITAAIKEFARALKPDGRIVITCDSQYDMNAPLPKYPGVNMDKFVDAVKEAGLVFDGNLDFDKSDAVYHPEWNLCCWHCVLKKAEAK